MQKLLLIIACCSFLWNYTIPQRYMRYEKGQILCGRRLIRMALLKLVSHAGSTIARSLTLVLIFLTWVVLSCYFIASSAAFPAFGLKVVALLAAILGTITLWQDMASAYRNFTEWCYNQEDSLITVSKGCWEIVLAGLICINMMLKN
ncbi:hypothetical protein [Sporomusa sp.]|uniref:hypothetical protein n=1 Tax=Sporomusa sp. TaxID=2078658 RepID=UPI002976955D|nr:hypothetical protein [Sporomusa sp.]MDF2570071.1 hypothetical protein [Sporomusa sp.]HWR07404.1 hypothetical protein [Sporomusa sp.]